MNMPRFLLLSAFLIIGALAAAPSRAEPAKTELKLGFVPGPYIDEFKAGVQPELEKKGYRIKYFEFSTGLEANNAVFKSEIDANVMQHTIFLNSYNERQKTDLTGIVHVPTPPMGLYSKKHALGTPIKPGSTVAVPNDPVNLQRALRIADIVGKRGTVGEEDRIEFVRLGALRQLPVVGDIEDRSAAEPLWRHAASGWPPG
jgi:D-methionine transport system substrate-binding protein